MFKTLNLKLEERQLKNQEIRVVVREGFYHDFGRKREAHIPRVQTQLPREEVQRMSGLRGQGMKTRKILLEGFGEDKALRSWSQVCGRSETGLKTGLSARARTGLSGISGLLAMDPGPSSLISDSPITSGLPDAQHCV